MNSCRASCLFRSLLTLRFVHVGIRSLTVAVFFGFSLCTASPAYALPEVASLSLIDARTGLAVPGYEEITHSLDIPLSTIPGGRLALRANTIPSKVRKVVFYINGSLSFNDYAPPFAVFGDDGGNYNSIAAQIGQSIVRVMPYDYETLELGIEKTFTLSIVSSSGSTPSSGSTAAGSTATTPTEPSSSVSNPSVTGPTVASFSLIDAATSNPIIGYDPISQNATVSVAVFSRGTFNIRANAAPALVRRVAFSVNARASGSDYSKPYSVFGDDGGNYVAQPATVGSYEISALPYDKETMVAGVSSVLKFSIVAAGSGSAASATATSPTTTTSTTTTSATTTTTTIANSSSGSEPLAVFPGAVGFGTATVAGSGRHLSPPATNIYRVTNLKDSGAGSLRDCALAAVPRTCVFDISGTILLQSEIKIRQPYLTIAGQTAPAPGVLLRGAGIYISTHDVLIQHLQVRPGDSPGGPSPGSRDAINVLGSPNAAYNVVLDHLSVSWAIDENFSTSYPNTHNISITNSIISEALYHSIHPKGAHSMGLLVGDGSQRVSVHGNLFAFNGWRNPRIKPKTSVEFVNNVVYGWDASSGYAAGDISDTEATGSPVLLRFEGNYYKAAPWSYFGPVLSGKPASASSRVYVLNNIGPSRLSNSGDEWKITGLAVSPFRVMTPPILSPGLSGFIPADTLNLVASQAGSRPRDSNSVDNRVLSEVLMGNGNLKDCVSGCTRNAGGWPVLGVNTVPYAIPANPMGDDDGDGYTNLENALHLSANKVSIK